MSVIFEISGLIDLKSIFSLYLERQNVNLVLRIFNEYSIQGLIKQMFASSGISCRIYQHCLYLVNNTEYKNTIQWLSVFPKSIRLKVNAVQRAGLELVSLEAGVQHFSHYTTLGIVELKKKYCKIVRVNQETLIFLSVFCDWFESWNSISERNDELTKETFIAFTSYNGCISWIDQVLRWRIENAIQTWFPDFLYRHLNRPIFMISGSNEQWHQELEYTLLKPDCHSW